jgi:hypothetical protein
MLRRELRSKRHGDEHKDNHPTGVDVDRDTENPADAKA